MADVKISALPASTTPLAGTEVLPIVQSGTTVKVSVANLTAGRAIGATDATFTGALNVTPTWNNVATTFTGIGLNVTDTASAAGSLLMNLQVGGVSRFNIRKDGAITMPSVFLQMANDIGFNFAGAGQITLNPTGQLNWGSAGLNTPDLALFRDAANTLAQRNGVNAQTFRIYNTFTDASNYERANFRFFSGRLIIQTEGAGTGVAGRISIVPGAGQPLQFGANGIEATWQISTSNHFLCATDNTFDIGASGANRPRNVFIGGNITGLVNLTATSAADSIGTRGVPQNNQSADYTLVIEDAGKHILHPSADTTARTFTIPANGTVAFPIGTTVSFVNQNGAGVITIAITTDTMRLAGAGTTGSRTLAANGIATCIKLTSTEWLISGTGLT
jgi:hypothetical protein